MNNPNVFRKSLKGILVIWFVLCILPGDCLLLGCGEKDVFQSGAKEVVCHFHNATDSSVPLDGSHCPDCCALCSHNLVFHFYQDSLYSFCNFNHCLKILSCRHSSNILQAVIYHPPRIVA